jgi:hypothetical protein
MVDITQEKIAYLAEGRVKVSIPPKSLNTFLGTLDRFKSDERA